METLLPRLQVCGPIDDGEIEPLAAFGTGVREVWLEVGFGAGEHLLAQALAHPDIGMIGCEPYRNGVARLVANIALRNVNNIRIYNDDARALLARLVPARLERVFVLFSDPWPKKRHWPRRFISTAALDSLSRAMADGATIRFASDDMGYVRWSLDLFERHPCFEWCAETARDWRDLPENGFETRYQAKATARGARCVYLEFFRWPRLVVGEKAL